MRNDQGSAQPPPLRTAEKAYKKRQELLCALPDRSGGPYANVDGGVPTAHEHNHPKDHFAPLSLSQVFEHQNIQAF